MLKGIQKNMIFVQLPKGKYFEGAYFVIRSRFGKEAKAGEMVKEANRIIGELELVDTKGKRLSDGSKLRSALCFVWGVLTGCLGAAIVWLVTLLVL